ncbi:MAG: hypothetical protein CBD18_04815 [Opitutales bacterium TMED158]|nr:MAG: hypothetical protein CBD18_04815 [Opitutales bacterium TMED158]
MTYRYALVSVLAMTLTASAVSQNYTLNLDLAFGSKYVFRGIQLADDVIHPSIEISQDDFYIGVWAAQPLENRGWPEYWDDEVDFYGGYGWALDEKTSVDIGGAYYYYPTGDSTLEPYLGITREIQGVAASLYLYRDLDLDTTTAEGAASYRVPVRGFASFDLKAFAGTVDADRQGSYFYYGADVVLPFELKDNATLSLGAHYSDHDLGNLVPDSHFYGSASLTIGF